jgi:competence protein ComEC
MAGILLSIGLFIFGRKHYLYVWLALGAIWMYVIITGMNPPVVRGAIMASLFLAAELLGRQRSAIIALVFAAAVMVGVHPYILGDASFQLSFLAMTGLVFIFPVLRDFGRRMIASKLGEEGTIVSLVNIVVDTMSATLAAVIAVWPVVAYYFGMVSLVGPLATFLALPAFPIIIVAGGLAAVLGLGVTVIGQIFGWLAWPFLSYMILVVSGLAAPSVSSVEIGSFHPAFIWGYYAILATLIWFQGRRQRIRNLTSGTAGHMRSGINLTFGFKWSLKWVLLPLLLLAMLVSYTAATFPDNTLRVSFLDVGEGDAILIQKGTRQVLVDGGPSPGAINLALSSRMPFWDKTIEMVVLTHPHHDHLAGLVEVLRRYEVKQVVYSDVEYDSSLYDEWWRVIDEKCIASIHLSAGHRIDLGEGVIVEVLNPLASPLSGTESDIDNNGLVLRLGTGDISFLLAADIMKAGEWQLIRERADLAATVLKAGHHGSDTSTTLEFLSVVNPQAAVICCGADNKFGHPNDEVVSRLENMVGDGNVFCTADHGTIDFITDGERLWVEVEK